MKSNCSKLNLHDMMSRTQWVLWKYLDRDGKRAKIPFTPKGKRAKVNDPSTWSSFEDCVKSVDGYEGIGFVFTSEDPFVGIDLDGCRDPITGVVSEWAQKLINLADSYAEVSPSETGVKIFVPGEWPHGGQKRTLDEPKVGEKTPGIEVYAEKRYFTVTGQRISDRADDAEVRQEPLDWIFKTYFSDLRPVVTAHLNSSVAASGDEAGAIERARRYVAKMPPAIGGKGGHNTTFSVACTLILGFGLGEEDAMNILLEYNLRCQPHWSEEELRHKLQDADKQPGPRNYLRNSASNPGSRTEATTSLRNDFGDPAHRSDEMESLVKQYIDELEAVGEAPKVPTGIKSLDHVLGGGLNFGDLVVLGGLSSHLKSGFAQQIGHHTTRELGRPFGFISLEMSERVLAQRTLQFASAMPRGEWEDSTAKLRDDARQHF